MKKIIIVQLLFVIVALFGMTSCDKSASDGSDSSFVSNYITTTISGIVFDDNHSPINGAKISAYGRIVYSDVNGVFLFKEIFVPKHRCFIVVENNNYFSIMRSKTPIKNGVTRLDAHLISYNNADVSQDNFAAGNPYIVNLSDGSSINFPGGAAFVDQNGNAYTGNVNVNSVSLDATTENYSRRAPAGDQIGIDAGTEMLLDTRTGILVELTDDNGKPVNLAQGSTADISAQIPASLVASSPGGAPMYYASTSNSYNNRSGDAVKNGDKYESAVGHFSYWSTQIASPDFGTIKCKVIDASGNILVGVRVQVGSAYGITAENGMFDMKVPTGISIDVAVRSSDFYGLSISNPQSAFGSGEQRLVVLQLPQDLNIVKGSLVDCYSHSVEAQVSLSWGVENVSTTYATGGSFELPTYDVSVPYQCQMHILSSHYDTTITIDVTSSMNNLGVISLCSSAPEEGYVNTVRIDSVASGTILNYSNFNSVTEGYLTVEYGTLNPIQTNISISGTDGNISLSLLGVFGTGTYSLSPDVSVYIQTNGTYILEGTGSITITEYGSVGGIIKGSVDGIASDGSIIHIEFEVERTVDVEGA